MSEYWNPTIETMSPDQLRSLQEEKLLRQLPYVWKTSPFYLAKLKKSGIDPNDIRSLDDLSRLPFTEKDELRQSQEDSPPLGLHVCAPMDDLIRIHSSSGTTGVPTFVGITGHDHRVWTEITARSLYTQGLRSDDVVIHAAGLTFFVGGLPIKDAIEHIGATFVPIGTGASDRVVTTTRRLAANALHCTPSYASYLANYVKEKHGLEPADLGFKKLFLGAEPGGGIPSVRKRLEEAYSARVTEGLGNSDAAPILFGECKAQQGMHFCGQEFIYCELIDPETGADLALTDGAEGELVYTHLDRQSCPLIRFRTHDLVKIRTSTCDCGRTGFRVRCKGRSDDMLIVLGVNVFPSAIKDIVTSFQPITNGEMLVVLDKPGPGVEPPLNLLVESTAEGLEADQVKKRIEEQIREKLLFRANIKMLPIGSLPRSEMKTKLIKVM